MTYNIDDLSKELSNINQSDKPNYDTILDIHTRIISLKINTIITKMNNFINESNTKLLFDKLPLHFNYIFSLLDGNYPSIKKKVKQIEEIINKIDLSYVHPLIMQPLIVNIIYSIYISDICSNPDIVNNDLILSIQSIQTNIELIFSSFNNIFTDIDDLFNDIEDKIGYNKIANLSHDTHDKLFNELISKDHISKLNIMIIQIEHYTHYDMNEIDHLDINSKLDDDTSILKNKLELDLIKYKDLKILYEYSINRNYNNLTKFGCFEDTKSINIKKYLEKNMIYYWIDCISFLNNNIIQKMFKK